MAAKFKHTNFLRNDRYQSKINAALTISKTRHPIVLQINFIAQLPALIPCQIVVDYGEAEELEREQ